MGDSEAFPFGDVLRQFRGRARISQQELADQIGVHRNTIGGWERGDYLPAHADVLAIIKALNLGGGEKDEFLRSRYEYGRAETLSTSSFSDFPHPRNLFFTGRDNALASLHALLTLNKAAEQPQPLAISGLGGIGKTQTAIEYAYRYHQQYKKVLWVKSETHGELVVDLVSIAKLLGLPQKHIKDQNHMIDGVKKWLTDHAGWLLILDNVEDLQFVNSLVPPAHQGSVLLTTRTPITSATARVIELDKMEEDEGALFLLKRAAIISPDAAEDGIPGDAFAQAKSVSRILDGHPLALDQAGAYINETQCSLSDYLDLYQHQHTELLQRRGEEPPGHPESVTSTFSLSFKKVKRANPAAADLLCFCACLSAEAIPETLITQGVANLSPKFQSGVSNQLALNEAIKALRNYSLVRRDPKAHTLTIHRLVQIVLKDGLDAKSQQYWAECAVLAVNWSFSGGKTWQQRQPYLPHAQVCAAIIEKWQLASAEAMQLLYHIGCHLLEIGDYFPAEHPFTQALAIHEQVLGSEHPDTVRCMDKIAEMHYHQGRYFEAITLHGRVLALRREMLGPEHPDIARSLNELGLLQYTVGEYLLAESLLTQAVRMRDQVLESGHLDIAESLNNLALLFTEQRKYDQAEILFQRALAIREQTLGPSHPDVAFDLLNLAQLYSNQSDFARAEPLIKRALVLRKQTFGSNHPDVAQCLNSLALLYYEQGNFDLAEPPCKRALAIRQRTLQPEHPDVAQSLNVLGLLYQEKKEYIHAERLYLKVLGIREQVLGTQHPKVALTIADLASLYTDQERYLEAEPLFKRALAIYEQTLDPQHPHVVKAQAQYVDLQQRAKGGKEVVV